MALIYDSSHSGQEIDAAVDAVQTTIPSQLTQIGLKIGDLSNLTTTAKNNIVAAVNEVKSATNTNAGSVSSLQGQVGSKSASSSLDSSNLWDAVDEVIEKASASGAGKVYAELNKVYNMLIGVEIVNDKTINRDGTEKSWSSGLYYCRTDYIPVYADVTYVCHCYGIAFYDSSKNFVESTTTSVQFREYTPPQNGYIIVSFSTKNLSMDRLCRKEDMYISRWDALGERNPWSDPKQLCAVEMYGSSTTYGYGLDDRSKCWANRLGASILSLPEYQYCGANEFSSFCQEVYSYQPKLFNNGGVVFFSAYTDEMVVIFSSATSVAVEIDGETQTNITELQTTYTLSLGLHTIKLVGVSGNNVLNAIRIHKVRTFVNNGRSGIGTSSLNTETPPKDGIAIIMLGTNDRALNYGNTASSWTYFLYKAALANCKVYVFTPQPTQAGGESSAQSVKTLRDVITELPNVHLIDVYKDMMLYSMLSPSTIYLDNLHLNELGHKVLYVIAASKLQLAALKSEIE